MKFNYDIEKFIKCVEEHCCLWDKSLESHKDRIERRAAWEEIFNTLDSNYEYMSPSEKRQFGEVVIQKWAHIRDTFLKTLKPRQGKLRRKYMHHDHLTFLFKNMPPEQYQHQDLQEDEYNMKVEALEDDDDVEAEIYTPVKKKPRKKVSKTNDSFDDVRGERSQREKEDNEFSFAGVEDDSRVMNEDEAFFASLLPTVVNYNEDERLDFRLEVLGVMKKIKQKRKWSGED